MTTIRAAIATRRAVALAQIEQASRDTAAANAILVVLDDIEKTLPADGVAELEAPTRAAKGAIEAAILDCFHRFQPDGMLPHSLTAEQFVGYLPDLKPDSIKATLRRMVKMATVDLDNGQYRRHAALPLDPTAKTLQAVRDSGVLDRAAQ